MGLKSEKLIVIGGSPYRVLSMDEGIENGFLLGYAYHVKTELTNKILPFIKTVKSFNHIENEIPGIYVSKKSKEYMIIYPNANDAQYNPINVKMIDDIFHNVDFIETDIDLSIDGDTFNPPIRVDDDPMNKIVKIAISLKGIVLDAYKKRFDNVGTNSRGNNNKNNAKRALLDNRSLSCNKAKEYGDVLDYQYAIIITDKPGARHPMATNGRPLIIYSNEVFDISNPIDVSTMGDKINLDFNSDS